MTTLYYGLPAHFKVIEGEVIEIREPTDQEFEKSVRIFEEEYGHESVQETQYLVAKEQRKELLENAYFTQRG